MSLIRTNRGWLVNPFNTSTLYENSIQKLFSDVFGDQEVSRTDQVYTPRIDIKESKDSIIIETDFPGFHKDEITIDISPEAVELAAEHKEEIKEENEENNEKIIRHERYAQKFYRKFSLPCPIDTEKINTSFVDGTLKLEIAKQLNTGRRRITL
jgi:HSP20 family protein